MLQISCVSYWNEFTNGPPFQQYYQLLPSEQDVVNSLAAIVSHYEWKRVSLFIERTDRFITVSLQAEEKLAEPKE